MRRVTQEELDAAIEQHRLWLNDKGGSQLNFSGCDLSGLDMRRSNLCRANLYRANLTRVNLTRAILAEVSSLTPKTGD